MKQFIVFVLILGAAAAGWFARDLIPKKHIDPDDEPAAKSEKSPASAANGVIKLDDETRERLAIESAPLATAEFAPHVTAVGRVLDPSPLLQLDQEITAARAALDISHAEQKRATTLFQNGENIPRKNVEAANAQVLADELKLEALHRRLPLEWGAIVNDSGADTHIISDIASGRTAILRVETLADEALPSAPASALVKLLADASLAIPASRICTAPSVDARTQSPAFLLQCAVPTGHPLPPGAAVTAELRFAGQAAKGILIPRSAIVRVGQQPWVYLVNGEGAFERHPVTLDTRTDTGWFVTEHGDLKPGAKIVTSGAQALFSSELTGSGEPD